MRVKKLWICLVCVSFLIIGFGCFSKKTDYKLDYEELKEQVVAVEIIYVHETNENISYNVGVVKEENMDSFLKELCQLTYAKFVPPKSSSGKSVKLVHKDGSYVVISVYGGAEYNSKGEWEKFGLCATNEEMFLSLIDKYIVEE